MYTKVVTWVAKTVHTHTNRERERERERERLKTKLIYIHIQTVKLFLSCENKNSKIFTNISVSYCS